MHTQCQKLALPDSSAKYACNPKLSNSEPAQVVIKITYAVKYLGKKGSVASMVGELKFRQQKKGFCSHL